jgi:hypothetical protein
LTKRSGGGVFFVNRIHWLKTGKDALQPLRIMAGLGISADSTFGPHSRGKGYVFGAGFPFFLLDTNAGIINLKEFPFQVQDTRGGAGAGYVKALVQDSLAKWHSSIVALYHPHFFKKRSPAWSAWSAALDFAGHPDIWQVNFKEYLSFSAERKRSRLQSDFDWQSLRLSISLEARQVQALRIPAVSGRLRLKGISAQGQPVEARQLHDYALISVPPGKGSYAADYEYSG